MWLQSREADGHQILDAAGNIFRQSVQKHHNSVTTFSPMILNFGGMASSTMREYLSIALKHQDYGNMLQKLQEANTLPIFINKENVYSLIKIIQLMNHTYPKLHEKYLEYLY